MLVVITMCSFPAQSQHLLQQKRNVQHSKELVRNVSTLVITDHCKYTQRSAWNIPIWQAVLVHKRITNNLFLEHHISASYFNSDTQVLNLSGLDPGTVDLTQTYCPALNVSQCLVRFSSQFLLMSISPLLSLNMKFITKQDHLLAGERGGGILHCLCVQPPLMECQPLHKVISVLQFMSI